MKAFSALFTQLDQTTRTNEKVAALESYFRAAPAQDAAWALWFLTGQRMKRVVKPGLLRVWAAEAAGLPLWMVEECYETVGDLAETLALLLPSADVVTEPPALATLAGERLRELAAADEVGQREMLLQIWAELDAGQRFLWHKLITGAFRVGVARGLVVRALARVAGVEQSVMTHRLMGEWQPRVQDFQRLMSGEDVRDDPARPYPFFLASPLEVELPALGEVAGWQLEWKWDGIRAQLLRRQGQVVLWSRGEEIITQGFPELAEAAAVLPDGTVLDGELLAWSGTEPLPFSSLQRRLNRRSAPVSLRAAVPVVFMAYDLLEQAGVDLRQLPLRQRRERLVALLAGLQEPAQVQQSAQMMQGELFAEYLPASTAPLLQRRLLVSECQTVEGWEQVAALQQEARQRGVEGLMLKQKDSAYGVGRQRGAWWKWKVQPYVCDAVLIAAQPGHGRRATLFTDYTFGVWSGEELVPVAKAYSGLTDAEIKEVDAFVRGHTKGRFGPVRGVEPELVFELAFEGIAESGRHRSGIALRFPRISRWRRDKVVREADSIQTLQGLMQAR